jgi:HD-GYP domain-containing protein (c-di-GMP phosphodiesterase class II)
MTETQELLSKIAALRQRLEQAQGLVQDAGSAAAALTQCGDTVERLQHKVAAGARQQALLETALRQFPGIAGAAGDGASLPAQLTARAARLLRRTHELLSQLKAIAAGGQLPAADGHPLEQLYRQTLSMTETVLRTVEAFPEAPSAQIRLCEGLEAVLGVVAERLGLITVTLQQRRRQATQRHTLAELLAALAHGHRVDSKELVLLAESIREEMAQGAGLSFPNLVGSEAAEQVAGHSLAVAQVMARLTRHDSQWRGKPLEPILAALVHDAGMVQMPAGLLGQEGTLKDEERRLIETHAILGADMVSRLTPAADWLVEAAGQHHEYLDGTGYPAGLRDLQIKPLIRFLAVGDVYAALCQPRAHRAALDTRTALTDTLLLAEKGLLDHNVAERLLLLSFYPVGSVVELGDGATGLVVATHQGRRDLNTPARPVVALLTDSQGQMLPRLQYLDLAETEGRSIVRTVPAAERRERLGRRYPELV